MRKIKKVVIIIAVITGACALLLAGLYWYADNSKLVDDRFSEKIETGTAAEKYYAGKGSHQTVRMIERTAAPIKKYTIFYPAELEEDDAAYPVILYVNGTGGKASRYEPLLEQLASWGFIVVGTEDKATGTGESTIRMLNHIIEEHQNPQSIFYRKINTEKIGAAGFSQGGAGVLNAVSAYPESSTFHTAVLLSPPCESTAESLGYPYDLKKVHCPVLMLAGTSGEFELEFVIPYEQMNIMYDKIEVPKMMARKKGMTHDDMVIQGQGYLTAWMLWQLQDDPQAADVFTGNPADLSDNSLYQDFRTNLESSAEQK